MKRQEMSKGQRVMVKLSMGGWREGWLMEPRTMAYSYRQSSDQYARRTSALRVWSYSSTGTQVGYPVMTRASGLTPESELPALCGELVRGQDIEDWDTHHARARAIEAKRLALSGERERNVEAMRERASRLPLSASQVASLTWVAESWRPAATEPSGRLTMTIDQLEEFALAVQKRGPMLCLRTPPCAAGGRA